MCRLCDEGRPQQHWNSRRGFLKAAAAAGVTGSGAMGLFAPTLARADDDNAPEQSGRAGRRYLIRGGAVMSMDPAVGDFVKADVLVEGKKILAVGPNLQAGGAAVIDARGRILGDVILFTDERKDSTSSGQLVLSDDWTTAQGVVAFGTGERKELHLGTSYLKEGYTLNNSIYANQQGDQTINFHDAYRNVIKLSGIVGEGNVLCAGTVKGDVVSLNDESQNPTFLPSKLVLRNKGQRLQGDVIFKDGTVVKVNMQRKK